MTKSIQRHELQLQCAARWAQDPQIHAVHDDERAFFEHWLNGAQDRGFSIDGDEATEEELRRARLKPGPRIVDETAEQILSDPYDLALEYREAAEVWADDPFVRIAFGEYDAFARHIIATGLCCGGIVGGEPPPIHHLEIRKAARHLWIGKPVIQAAYPDERDFIWDRLERARTLAVITGIQLMTDGSERVSLRGAG
jgi:hypothetical protein